MIEYFAKEGSKICELLLRKWDILREMAFILQIPLRATINLQKHDIGLSDAFAIWTKMQLHLQACLSKKNYKTSLANHLIKALEVRNHAIFANSFMDGALFLDPRFRNQVISNETRKNNCKALLVKVWQRINGNHSNSTDADSSHISEISFDFDAQAALNAMMQKSTPNDQANASQTEPGTQIEQILDSFNPERMPCEKSVLEFWENSKLVHPELYKLAMAIYAVPPSETQIERDFSRLNFVFTERRCSLQSQRLNDIMFISINPSTFYSVRDEELEVLNRSLQNKI